MGQESGEGNGEEKGDGEQEEFCSVETRRMKLLCKFLDEFWRLWRCGDAPESIEGDAADSDIAGMGVAVVAG